MTTDASNPFVLPGFGQTGAFAGNPVMASMEMMRQAWQSLAGQGGLGAPSMAATLSAEELERRITDLRAVENWLRMNLTVLSSTIQGLEVQRATLSTLKHFVHNTSAVAGQDVSGFDSLFGPKSAKPSVAKTAQRASEAPQAATQQAADAASDAPHFNAEQAIAATQAWWDVLRQQFDSLAAATAAGMPPATSSAHVAAKPSTSPRKAASTKPKTRTASTKPARGSRSGR